MKLAPHARLLLTSRAALGVAGEHLVALEPLALPEPGMSREALLASEGAALFVSRAREVCPDFAPGEDELAALAEVVRATDGIPLAIELAAARATRRALALYRQADCEDRLPSVLYEAGVIALFRDNRAEARASFDEALAIARRTGDRYGEGALLSARGILIQEEGDLDSALSHHAEAVRIFHELGTRHREGSALYYLGTAFLERGMPGEATKILVRSFELMGAAGFRRYEVLIAGCLAATWAGEGDAERALEWLARARAAALACESEPALQVTLALHEAHVALASVPEAARSSHLGAARSLAQQRSNDDVRFALRILLAAGKAGAPAAAALSILEGGAAFRLPGARSSVDLSRRAPLRRILLALARLRTVAPGQPLPLDDLVRAGWPGERIGADAAANRVRVALTTLRKLGLREVIKTGQGGYLLDPATAVVIGDE